MVANGESISCPGIYSATHLSVDDEIFTTDFFPLLLASYDMVLGTQWLGSLGSILWDFDALTLSFWCHYHKVCWQGVASPSSPSLQVCFGNDLLTALLNEFAAVFAEPVGMPPQDHNIP